MSQLDFVSFAGSRSHSAKSNDSSCVHCVAQLINLMMRGILTCNENIILPCICPV